MSLTLFAREMAVEVKAAIGQAIAAVTPRLQLLESDAEKQRTLNGERHKGFDAEIGDLRAQIAALTVQLAEAKSAGMAEWTSAIKALQPIPGPIGPVGPQGPPGVGLPGERGERGLPGESIVGPEGQAGRTVVGPEGKPGLDGRDGVDGKAGTDGLNGKDGADGLNGKDGRDGLDGKDGVGLVGPAGADGVHGMNGKDGRDGISIAGATVTRQGTLQITLSDGQTKDAGPVGPDPDLVARLVTDQIKSWPVPKDGAPGPAGRDGTLEQLTIGFEDKRTLVFLRKDTGDVIGRFFVPIVIDEGVYKSGTFYLKGSGVTKDGSFWIAQEDTRDRPGESKSWRLAVRKGSDGKDGKDGKDGD